MKIKRYRWGMLMGLLCCASATAQTITNPIAALKNHVTGTAPLATAEIVTQGNSLRTHLREVGTNAVALAAAFDLVNAYDTTVGAIFTTPATQKGFKRDAAGFELAQALFDLQQGILDYAYTPASLASNSGALNGRKFGTAAYFPGAVTPPDNPNTGYAVRINAAQPEAWGAEPDTVTARRPTGCYVAPGSIAYVTVPASLVNQGFAVRVGAHSWDLKAKPILKRLDRVSLVYPVTSTTIPVANPLGGNIYLEVPYLAHAGIVTVGITNVVRSPFFSATSFHKTTPEEWLNSERTQPGPWADFESDKFMMQVPRSWIYNYAEPVTVMQDWDKAMDTVSDLMGLPRLRSKTVLYAQIDVSLRGSANFPGYPMSNFPYNPNAAETGNKDHFFLTGPRDASWTVLHELGHAQRFTKFNGETEAVVNLLYVAVQNQNFGVPLDLAFGRSVGYQSREKVSLAQAALTWVLTDSFRNGQAMDANRMKYQQRGYGKYVEIANLFGWGALSNFWHSGHVEAMTGKAGSKNSDINRDPPDSRILRMSKAAGVDLRPLIHFWGVHPVNPVALQASIQSAGLKPSALIYDRLKYYESIVPTDQMQFDAHYAAAIGAVSDTIDKGSYAEMKDHFKPELGSGSIRAVQQIIDLYFPAGRPNN